MAEDKFKTVRWTAGQEVRAQDLSDVGKFLSSMISDQLLAKLAAGDLETAEPGDGSVVSGGGGSAVWLHALTVHGGRPQLGSSNRKVRISAGTVFQRVGAETGDDRTFLPWTFDGTDEITISDGDASNPRFDLIQLRLRLEDADPQHRVYANPTTHAALEVSALTTNISSLELSATLPGSDGNSVRVSFQPWAGPGLRLTETGRDLLVEFEDEETTVQEIVDAITADATLVVVTNYGAPTNRLEAGNDSFALTNLAGGADTVLVSEELMMKRRVVATLSLKQGPASSVSHVYPVTPDEGYVPLAVIWVPAGWTAAAPISHFMEESVSGMAVLHDLRMPLRVKSHRVQVRHMLRDPSIWEDSGSPWESLVAKSNVTTSGSHHLLVCPCPVRVGRLVGVTLVAAGGSGGVQPLVGPSQATPVGGALGGAVVCPFFSPGGIVDMAGSDISDVISDTTMKRRHADNEEIGRSGFGIPASLSFYGPHGVPIWCNGGRVPNDTAEPTGYKFRPFDSAPVSIGSGPYEHGVCVVFVNATDAAVADVVFHVAEGT